MAEKLRFGIVGCGVIGPTHAEAIASLPDAQLVAVTDTDAEKAQKLAARYGATPYTSLQTMLDHEQLDVVNICTPSGMHGEHACLVNRPGVHTVETSLHGALAALEWVAQETERSSLVNRQT